MKKMLKIKGVQRAFVFWSYLTVQPPGCFPVWQGESLAGGGTGLTSQKTIVRVCKQTLKIKVALLKEVPCN